MTYFVMCTGCGQPIADGAERPAELCFCSVACAIAHGASDETLRRLRELEAATKQ